MLPDRFRVARAEGYARRLLHRNDRLGYTAVVMTWAPGQRTPLHDHAGIWCVEGVVEGIKANVPELGKHLVHDAGTFDPAKPDPPEKVDIPPSPLTGKTEKPAGS